MLTSYYTCYYYYCTKLLLLLLHNINTNKYTNTNLYYFNIFHPLSLEYIIAT